MDKPNNDISDEALFDAHSTGDQNDQGNVPSPELELATVIAVLESGMVELKLDHQDSTVSAISTVPLDKTCIGRQAAVMFTQSSQKQAVVIGLIRSQLDNLLDVIDIAEESNGEASEFTHNQNDSEKTVKVDGKKVILTGEEEIVLKCGASSITLTKAGKIMIRGKSLLNRASGVNRILGGSVQVN